MATKLDISVDAGSDVTYEFMAVDEKAVPVDLTGANITMTGRYAITAPDATLLFTSAPGGNITLTDAANGTWSVYFPASYTANITLPALIYDQYAVYPNGRQYRLSQGYIFIDPKVTA